MSYQDDLRLAQREESLADVSRADHRDSFMSPNATIAGSREAGITDNFRALFSRDRTQRAGQERCDVSGDGHVATRPKAS